MVVVYDIFVCYRLIRACKPFAFPEYCAATPIVNLSLIVSVANNMYRVSGMLPPSHSLKTRHSYLFYISENNVKVALEVRTVYILSSSYPTLVGFRLVCYCCIVEVA